MPEGFMGADRCYLITKSRLFSIMTNAKPNLDELREVADNPQKFIAELFAQKWIYFWKQKNIQRFKKKEKQLKQRKLLPTPCI